MTEPLERAASKRKILRKGYTGMSLYLIYLYTKIPTANTVFRHESLLDIFIHQNTHSRHCIQAWVFTWYIYTPKYPQQTLYSGMSLYLIYFKSILPKGPNLPCISMAGRALLAGYHRFMHENTHNRHFQHKWWSVLCEMKFCWII